MIADGNGIVRKAIMQCDTSSQRQLEIPDTVGRLSARVHELSSRVEELIERLAPYSKQTPAPTGGNETKDKQYTQFGEDLRCLATITETTIGRVNDLLDRLEI